MSADMMKLTADDLYEGVEGIISATDFIELSEGRADALHLTRRSAQPITGLVGHERAGPGRGLCALYLPGELCEEPAAELHDQRGCGQGEQVSTAAVVVDLIEQSPEALGGVADLDGYGVAQVERLDALAACLLDLLARAHGESAEALLQLLDDHDEAGRGAAHDVGMRVHEVGELTHELLVVLGRNGLDGDGEAQEPNLTD
jgi:hypothetical protein